MSEIYFDNVWCDWCLKLTIALVAKVTIIRTLLVVAIVCNWPLWKIYMKSDFLHGDLQELVYMRPLLGYACPQNHVRGLRKSLYGLKQEPHAWLERFRGSIV